MAFIRYLVLDVPSCAQFYTECLGFELRQQFGPAMAIVAEGDLTLWLAGPISSAARAMPDGRKLEPGGCNRFVFEVENFSKMVTALKAKNINLRNEILEGPGGFQILCEDLSGNLIELFQAK
jgi:predicted enzyme related to lactoylglutathione lyase